MANNLFCGCCVLVCYVLILMECYTFYNICVIIVLYHLCKRKHPSIEVITFSITFLYRKKNVMHQKTKVVNKFDEYVIWELHFRTLAFTLYFSFVTSTVETKNKIWTSFQLLTSKKGRTWLLKKKLQSNSKLL